MLVGISGTKFSGIELAEQIFVAEHGFASLDPHQDEDELLSYVTKNYLQNYVVRVEKLSLLEKLEKRPFFVHISLDASVSMRLALAKKLDESNKENDGDDLGTLLVSLDIHDFRKDAIELREKSHFKFKLMNDDATQSIDIEKRLSDAITEQLKLIRKEGAPKFTTPLRPDWDSYFMKLATLAASRSNCMKRRVGCVIVRDCRVIATGYNGTPRHLTNCYDGGCPRCNDGDSHNLHTCLCLHAEENALLEAGRDRIGSNAVLFCDTCPCLTCSVKIAQTGITEVVYSQTYRMDQESFKVLKAAGVNVRQFNFIQIPKIIMV